MTFIAKNQTPSPRLDPASFFKKLGLTVADERPIMEAWRKANVLWREHHRARIAMIGDRINDHLRRFAHPKRNPPAPSRPTKGRPKAVWCVELRRRFPTMTEAGNFVGRTASNISQSLKRGVKCGPYHWEEFDEKEHGRGERNWKSETRNSK